MRTKHLFILPLLAGISILSSCNKEGCTDPTALNYDADAKNDDGSCVYNTDTTSMVMLHIHPKLGTADFAFDTEVTNWEGRKMKFTIAQMYLSGFMLHDEDGNHVMLDDTYLLEKPGTMMYELGEVPNGHYHELMFSVGVDSAANHSDPASWPTDHALSSNNPDHAFWSWNSGYIFIKMEGFVDTTAAMNGTPDAPFVYHIGMDMLKRNVELTMHQDVDDDVTVTLELDYLKLFNNVDLRMDQSTHTMDNMMPAQAVANNVESAFTLQ
jgi:hypothetical protein